MKFDWIAKLRHLLQTLAFCLAISALQYAFQPERPYEVPLVYSLGIGFFTWGLIDFGRHCYPSAQLTGWPAGLWGLALPLGGIVAGYGLGTLVGDAWFGWSSWSTRALPQLRVSLLITGIAGVAGTYFFYSKNRQAWLEARMLETQRHASEARLKLLETQLDPHMLFNTLANLRVLMGVDPARAQQMLDRMVAYLRATLDASRAPTHALATEFERLRDYLELMAIRMGPRLRYTLDLPAELAGQPVPTLLLQALVENSLQHGLEPQVAGGSIHVRAGVADGQLLLEVTDTGVGLPAGHNPGSGSGFGLAQVRERLQTLYGSAADMNLIANSPEGTRASIRFPLKNAVRRPV